MVSDTVPSTISSVTVFPHRFAVVSQAVQPTMDLILLFSNIKSLLGLSGHDDSVQSLEGLLGIYVNEVNIQYCVHSIL